MTEEKKPLDQVEELNAQELDAVQGGLLPAVKPANTTSQPNASLNFHPSATINFCDGSV